MEQIVNTAKDKRLVSVFSDTKYAEELVDYLLNQKYTVTTTQKIVKSLSDDKKHLSDILRYGKPRDLLKLVASGSVNSSFLIISTENLTQYEKFSAEICAHNNIFVIIVSPNVSIGYNIIPKAYSSLGRLTKINDAGTIDSIVNLINTKNRTLILVPNYGFLVALANKSKNNKNIVVSTILNNNVFSQYDTIIVHPKVESKIYREGKPTVVIQKFRSKEEIDLLKHLAHSIILLTDKDLRANIFYYDDTLSDIIMILFNRASALTLPPNLLSNERIKFTINNLKSLGLIDNLDRITDIGKNVSSYSDNLRVGLFLNEWLVHQSPQFRFPGVVISCFLEVLPFSYNSYSDISTLHSYLQLWYDITTDLKEKLLDQLLSSSFINFDPVYKWCDENKVKPYGLTQIISNIKIKCSSLNISTLGRFSVEGAVERMTPFITKIYNGYIAKRKKDKFFLPNDNAEEPVDVKYSKYPNMKQYKYVAVLEYFGKNNEVNVSIPTTKPMEQNKKAKLPQLVAGLENNYDFSEIKEAVVSPIRMEWIVAEVAW